MIFFEPDISEADMQYNITQLEKTGSVKTFSQLYQEGLETTRSDSSSLLSVVICFSAVSLVGIISMTVLNTLPQLKAHLGACLNVGCTPVELRETIYQCAPFIGFPKTLNAIGVLNEVLTAAGITLPLPKQGTAAEGERYEKGLALQKPVYGDEIKDRYTWLPKPFDEAVPRFLTGHCFGDFNTRTGLDGKTRELLTVIILAALGGAEVQVKSHVYGALKVGNTKEEVVCALVHASAYMGIPRLFNALNACKELLTEREP